MDLEDVGWLRSIALENTVKLFTACPPPGEFSPEDVTEFAEKLFGWLQTGVATNAS